MTWLWDNILYGPLLNALMWLYSSVAGENLGIAVVLLTVALRLILLPLSVVAERDSYEFDKLSPDIERINQETMHDAVQRKERIRELLKERKLHPWAKAWGIFVQALALIVLYRVFVDGIRLHLGDLYSWVPRPTDVNTIFLGNDIGTRSALWAGVVGLTLFAEIFIEQKRAPGELTRNDMLYALFFPLFTFLVLWWLPSVKSLFIFTSMLFSMAIVLLRRMAFPVPSTKQPGKA